MTDDYKPIKWIRENVFFGLGEVSFWRLRKDNKSTIPDVIGNRTKYMSESEAIEWRNKYWKRAA